MRGERRTGENGGQERIGEDRRQKGIFPLYSPSVLLVSPLAYSCILFSSLVFSLFYLLSSIILLSFTFSFSFLFYSFFSFLFNSPLLQSTVTSLNDTLYSLYRPLGACMGNPGRPLIIIVITFIVMAMIIIMINVIVC
jgi:hypothetical protein